jgi:hypothetical protein
MDTGKHRSKPLDAWRRLLPLGGSDSYPRLVAADQSDMRRIRVDQAMWDAYAEIVGDGGRAADIREYIHWRLEHPDDPLPGRWRGPVKRERQRRAKMPGPTKKARPKKS